MHIDFIFRQATVFDGTGTPPRICDVGIANQTIVAIGDLSATQAPVEYCAQGLWLTPGFIDAHTHSDAFLLLEPYAPSKLTQGVTTEIGGQCGGSAAPRLNNARLPSDWEAQIYPPRQGQSSTRGPNWTTVADYRTCFEAARPATNFILFAGHNTLRKGVMGDAPKAATPAHIATMIYHLEQALDEGAWGLSTGLVYHPGVHSQPEEVLALATTCAKRDGMYATHMRSESDRLEEAVEEVLTLTRATGIRTQISHLKTSGKNNWHKLPKVLEKIETARAEGCHVFADRYPYLSAGTDLDIVLPEWASAGGNTEILRHLDDARTCGRIAAEIDASGRDPYSIMIGGTWSPETRPCSGKTIGEIMRTTCRSMGTVITWILRKDRTRTGAFFFGMNETNLHEILKQPWVMPGSDASLRAPWGPLGKDTPHPRAYGTHPKYYRILTEQLGFSPEEAFRRMTSLPAQAFGISKRGIIKEGYYADLVLLNPSTWRDTADYTRSHSFSTGIDTVMVNGSPVLMRGQINPSAERRGTFLTRQH